MTERHDGTKSSNADNKRKKRIVGTAIACTAVLAGSAALMTAGIRAYLTDADTATNTFTVGEVKIDTLEPNYPGNGSDEVTDMVPMKEVPKDPQIQNSGKNRAIVYTQVDIPMAEIIVASEDGTRGPDMNQEIFNFRRNDAPFGEPIVNSYHDEAWTQIQNGSAGMGAVDELVEYLNEDRTSTVPKEQAKWARRLYGYQTVLDENETTTPVWDVVRLVNVIEDQKSQPDGAPGPGDVTDGKQTIVNKMLDNTTQNINITSYAIQAENIANLTTADWDTAMTKQQLEDIWMVYYRQTGSEPGSLNPPGDADTGNDQTLVGTTLNVSFTVANTHLKLNSGNDADSRTTTKYTVAYTGPGTKPTPTFTSSDTGVVTVDNSGNIQAVGVGTAVIEMRATNPDSGKDAVATVTVQVRDMNTGNADKGGN